MSRRMVKLWERVAVAVEVEEDTEGYEMEYWVGRTMALHISYTVLRIVILSYLSPYSPTHLYTVRSSIVS